MEKRSPSPFLTADSATDTFPASDGRASNWRKGAADLRRLSSRRRSLEGRFISSFSSTSLSLPCSCSCDLGDDFDVLGSDLDVVGCDLDMVGPDLDVVGLDLDVVGSELDSV
jgi:hypothetical protein